MATAIGTLVILAAALQLTPRQAGAPPPSWPTTAVRPGYLVAHGAPVGSGVAPAVASARLGSSSRGGVRSAAEPSPALSPTPSPTPTPQRPVTYVVVEGDTIAGLATRFGVTEETILWANDLVAGGALQAGQELTILPVSGVLYTVHAGDTLSALARAYGVDPQAIVAANDLAEPGRLSVGQELVIPAGRPLPPPTPTPAQPSPPPPQGPTPTALTAVPVPPPTPTSDGWREWGRGLATWYDGPTSTMRNGEPLDLDGLTCAVDASDWEALQGKEVRIRRQDGSDEGVIVRVTDSGYLKAAGRFVLDPASTNPDEGQYVIVDLPRNTHQRLFQGATTPVIVEVREEAVPAND